MKLFLLLLSLTCAVLCSNDDCVWNYKCCVFKEVQGQVTCEKMCEAEVLCNKANKVGDSLDSEELDPNAPLEIKANVCRSGYQFTFGRCRKVFKQRKND